MATQAAPTEPKLPKKLPSTVPALPEKREIPIAARAKGNILQDRSNQCIRYLPPNLIYKVLVLLPIPFLRITMPSNKNLEPWAPKEKAEFELPHTLLV